MKIIHFKKSHTHFLLVYSVFAFLTMFPSISYAMNSSKNYQNKIEIKKQEKIYISVDETRKLNQKTSSKAEEYKIQKIKIKEIEKKSEAKFITNIFGKKTFNIKEVNFSNILNRLFRVIFAIVGTILVISLAIEGTRLIYAQLHGHVDKIAKGKTKFSNVIFGLIILLLSWVILNTVNPQLLQPKLLLNLQVLSGTTL